MSVYDEFYSFKNNYNIGSDLISSIGQRYRRITARLNKDFWDTDDETRFFSSSMPGKRC